MKAAGTQKSDTSNEIQQAVKTHMVEAVIRGESSNAIDMNRSRSYETLLDDMSRSRSFETWLRNSKQKHLQKSNIGSSSLSHAAKFTSPGAFDPSSTSNFTTVETPESNECTATSEINMSRRSSTSNYTTSQQFRRPCSDNTYFC